MLDATAIIVEQYYSCCGLSSGKSAVFAVNGKTFMFSRIMTLNGRPSPLGPLGDIQFT